MCDLGSGTGILPIVTAANGGFKGSVYAIDKEVASVEATKMNSQIFGVNVNTVELDLVEYYMPKTGVIKSPEAQLEFYRSMTSELGIPMHFDLITCNPPWIPAEYIAEATPLDNGVYDPKEQFL